MFFNREETFKRRFDLNSNDKDRTNDVNIYSCFKIFLNLNYKIIIISPKAKDLNLSHPNLLNIHQANIKMMLMI